MAGMGAEDIDLSELEWAPALYSIVVLRNHTPVAALYSFSTPRLQAADSRRTQQKNPTKGIPLGICVVALVEIIGLLVWSLAAGIFDLHCASPLKVISLFGREGT